MKFEVEIEEIAPPVLAHEMELETNKDPNNSYRTISQCQGCRWSTRNNVTNVREIHDEFVSVMNTPHVPEMIGMYKANSGAKERELWMYRIGDPLPSSTWGGTKTRAAYYIDQYDKDWTESLATGLTHRPYWLILVRMSKTSWRWYADGWTRTIALARALSEAGTILNDPDEIAAGIPVVLPNVTLISMAEHLIKSYSLGNTRQLLEARTTADDAQLALELVIAWRDQIDTKIEAIMSGGLNAKTP